LTAQQALAIRPMTLRASLLQTERASLAQEMIKMLAKARASAKGTGAQSAEDDKDAENDKDEQIRKLKEQIKELAEALSRIEKKYQDHSGKQESKK
jgi:phosphoenolpyruvate synthase/pyruvate phosphate dikinase